MLDVVKEIIQENIEAIENNEFDKVYELIKGHTMTSWTTSLTETFFDANINPIPYIKNIIPKQFALDLKNSPSNIVINAEIIQSNAFYNCSNITSVIFNEDVRIIGYASFASLPNLVNVDIKEGVMEIQSNAFYRCPKLRSIKLPKSIKILGSAIFAGCSHNLKIEYDGTVEEFNQNVECARIEGQPQRDVYCNDGVVKI